MKDFYPDCSNLSRKKIATIFHGRNDDQTWSFRAAGTGKTPLLYLYLFSIFKLRRSGIFSLRAPSVWSQTDQSMYGCAGEGDRYIAKNDISNQNFAVSYELTKEEFEAFLATLGCRIKHLREEKKVLMRHFLARTGFYDAQWRKYEAGGSLTVQSLLKISLALEVTLGELLDGLSGWPKRSAAEIQRLHDIDPSVDKAGLEIESEPQQIRSKQTQSQKKRGVKEKASLRLKESSPAKKTKGKPSAPRKSSR
jgi:transcriptional regulator with XRE-family HTH domain